LNKVENVLELEEEMELLREKLNETVSTNMINTSDEYEDLLILSKKLDDIIVQVYRNKFEINY
jgi:hypothetical protein